MNELRSKRRPNRRAVAIIVATAAAALVAGGVVTAVVVTNAEAEETARQCAAALDLATTATTQTEEALANADASLTAVETTALPDTDGWTSGAYGDRPAGAELTSSVIDARTTVEDASVPNDCADRAEAKVITDAALVATNAVASLDESVAALNVDFELFQVEETARIAAEIEAARIAAEEAARVAAEAEAARVAAEAEAARQAAAQRQTWRPSGGSGSGGGGHPAPSFPNGGSFGVGVGGPNDAPCLTDNGMGGTMPCE